MGASNICRIRLRCRKRFSLVFMMDAFLLLCVQLSRSLLYFDERLLCYVSTCPRVSCTFDGLILCYVSSCPGVAFLHFLSCTLGIYVQLFWIHLCFYRCILYYMSTCPRVSCTFIGAFFVMCPISPNVKSLLPSFVGTRYTQYFPVETPFIPFAEVCKYLSSLEQKPHVSWTV